MRLTSVLMALLIAAGLWYWFVLRHDGAAPVAAVVAETAAPGAAVVDAPVPVVVLNSTAREVQGALVVRGRTKANRSVRIAAETSGRVVTEALQAGTEVSKDQVLCRLNPGVRMAELAEAEAALTEAEAEASAARTLQKKGFTAETTLKARQAQLQTAQARLDRVRWDIQQLEIRAPFDGFLESDTAEVGTLMAAGAHCATVIDLSRVKVTGFVAEQEVDQLSLGQPARARLINGITATGKITFLSRMADETTRTFGVEVTIENPDARIRDGMTAELQIALPARTAHLLPQSALTLDNQGRMGVRVADADIARFVPVIPVQDGADGIWVTGLPDTADIIVIGQEFVRDGRRIAPSPAGAADVVKATQTNRAAGASE